MQNLSTILSTRVDNLKKTNAPQKNLRPTNMKWEMAKEFAEYVNLTPPFVLRLIKIYGEQKVYGLRSWLKDCPHDPARYAGLVVWKLKQK